MKCKVCKQEKSADKMTKGIGLPPNGYHSICIDCRDGDSTYSKLIKAMFE